MSEDDSADVIEECPGGEAVWTRRRALSALGAGGVGLLAGCTGGSDEPARTSERTATAATSAQSETATPTATEETTATTERPRNYRLHLIPGRNRSVRAEVSTDQLDQYREEFGTDVVTEAGVFSEPAEDHWRNMEVDLLALEWWHDNDYENIQHDEGSQFVESIGTESEPGTIEHEAKNNPRIPYLNSEGESNTYGYFSYQEFSDSNSVGEALDWIQRYLFNFQKNWNDSGPISTEDELYTAVLQESLDNHTELGSHFWAFDLPEASRSTHGNGLAYDQTNNELRIIETVSGPETAESTSNGLDLQYHPLVEDSNYLNEDHDAYNSWWHPLRFADDHREDTVEGHHDSLDFETRKLFAADILAGITGGYHDEEDFDNSKTNVEAGIAISTEYIVGLTDKLLNWNTNDEYDAELFNEIKNQAKTYSKLRKEGENYVMYGTVESPNVAKVESANLLDRIWRDQRGQYDDFGEHIET
ncbi:hypothetical protein [Haloarchaeobius sp. FL176]|uniref:hypothetical protein n=1 Tax=Haloarchaeobius sp. FL176 TaxID=2967129 RepID=UPI0021474741|nr:hypothetical protein [Haloarchaeobius sp. FL176]